MTSGSSKQQGPKAARVGSVKTMEFSMKNYIEERECTILHSLSLSMHFASLQYLLC
jgi:hypothetical protein